MYLEIITVLLLAILFSVAFTALIAVVLSQNDEIKRLQPTTLADIIEYEEKMSTVDEVQAGPQYNPDMNTGSRAYELMEYTYFDILRVRGQKPAKFQWSVEQCKAYRDSQEIEVARRHPEMDRTPQFEALVDKLVVENMWAASPKPETAPEQIPIPVCAVCGEPAVLRTRGDVWLCGPHIEVAATLPEVPDFQGHTGDCNATDGKDFCDLPVGHAGAHSWAQAQNGHAPDVTQDALMRMIHGG